MVLRKDVSSIEGAVLESLFPVIRCRSVLHGFLGPDGFIGYSYCNIVEELSLIGSLLAAGIASVGTSAHPAGVCAMVLAVCSS